jgi:hypothetical protein
MQMTTQIMADYEEANDLGSRYTTIRTKGGALHGINTYIYIHM